MREYSRKIPWIYKHGVGGSARRVDLAGLEGGRATLAYPKGKADEDMTDEEIKAKRAEEEALIRKITRKD